MSFNSSREIKACRKPHRCHWCDELIAKGQPAVRVAGVWDGDFGHSHYHPECNASYLTMDWKEREASGVDEGFEPGLFQRGTKEKR